MYTWHFFLLTQDMIFIDFRERGKRREREREGNIYGLPPLCPNFGIKLSMRLDQDLNLDPSIHGTMLQPTELHCPLGLTEVVLNKNKTKWKWEGFRSHPVLPRVRSVEDVFQGLVSMEY